MSLTRIALNMVKGAGYIVTDIPGLSAVSNDVIFMAGYDTPGDGAEGFWYFDDSDFSTEVAADTLQGLYIAPSTDDTGASGAWRRMLDAGFVAVNAFGAKGDSSTNDQVAIQAALDNIDGAGVRFLANQTYMIGRGLYILQPLQIEAYGATIKKDSAIYTAGLLVINGTDDGDHSGYGATSDITLRGGIWDCDNWGNAFGFGQCENIQIIDAEVWNVDSGSHAIELIAAKNSVVRNFRAIGYDGASTDGKAAVQLDYAEASTHFPQWTNPLTWDQNPCEDITLDGIYTEGWPRSIESHGYSGASDPTQKRINISNVSTPESGSCVVRCDGWQYVNITNVTCNACGTEGVYLTDCYDVNISNCVLYGSSGSNNGILAAIKNRTVNYDLNISNCSIQNFDGDGIDIQNMGNVNVNNCLVEDVGGHGIRIYESYDVGLNNCRVRQTGGNGIYCYTATANRKYITINNCSVRSPAARALYISGCNGTLVTGCTLQTDTNEALLCYDSDYCRISACYLEPPATQPAMNLTGNSSYCGITNCIAYTGTYGIVFAAGSNYNLYMGNHLSWPTTAVSDSGTGNATSGNL